MPLIVSPCFKGMIQEYMGSHLLPEVGPEEGPEEMRGGTRELAMQAIQKQKRSSNHLLKRQRELRGWSREKMVKELQAHFPEVAVTVDDIVRWENGKRRPSPYYREKLCILFETTADKLGLIPQDISCDQDAGEDETVQEAVISSLWTVPSRHNPFFTGREQLLQTIRERFVNGGTPWLPQIQALCGLGGIGKTQTAIEYSHRYREAYQFVLWVKASQSTLFADFVTLADPLNLPEKGQKDQSILVTSVKRWLASHESWLLIFDNVDDIELVYDILPADLKGHVLLTTRLYALGTFAHRIEVEKMNAEEGALIQCNCKTKTLTIHRLVQATIQNAMNKDARRTWIERATQIVCRTLPYTSSIYSTSGFPHYAVQLLRVSIHKDQEFGNKAHLAAELRKLAVQQQVLGRLKASEQSLQESLALSREIGDRFHEAKTHQYFALLRAYQGLFPASFTHLETAVSLINEANIVGLDSAISAYRSLCALLAGDIQKALIDAQYAWEQANAQGDERDMIRAEWMLGNALIRLTSAEGANNGSQITQHLEQAEIHLQDALERCRRNKTVDYEADLLLAWARLYTAKGDHVQARASAMEALAITNCSTFRVLRADIHVLLARLALANGDQTAAMIHAQAAFDDAHCDGIPYCYQSALEDGKRLLEQKLIKV